MTTLLPPSELAMLRAIARTAAVLLVCLRIDYAHPGRAIADFEIADILEADKRTVQKQLRSLSAAGLMLEQREGRYVVTVAGKNTLFGGQTSLSIENTAEISETLEIARTKCASKKEEEEELNLKIDSSSSNLNLKNAQNVQIGREISFAVKNGLTVVPEIIGLQFENDEPVYQMPCVDGSFVTTREIIGAADMLDGFENGIVTNNLPIDAIKPEDALAWIAQAFDQRERLHNPAGLVYKRLQDIEKPRANLKYRRNPKKFFPTEYLVFLKLADPEPAQVPIDSEPELAEPDITILAEDASLTPIWAEVLRQMQTQMPKASYESWLRHTYPVALQGQALIVAVRNAYCRDWLESRALDAIQRCAGRDVQFVVSAETEV